MTSLVVLILPRTVLPVALYDIGLVLIILRVAVLAGSLTRELSIEGIATSFEYKSTTFEILRSAVLLLILALRVCAHLCYCY